MKWFAVQGRVPRDDDDTVMVFQAENADEARAQFKSAMRDGDSEEAIDACDKQFDTVGGVYIINVLESDTEIREVA